MEMRISIILECVEKEHKVHLKIPALLFNFSYLLEIVIVRVDMSKQRK